MVCIIEACGANTTKENKMKRLTKSYFKNELKAAGDEISLRYEQLCNEFPLYITEAILPAYVSLMTQSL